MKSIIAKITTDFYNNGPVSVEWEIKENGDCINTFNGVWFCNIINKEGIEQIKPEMIRAFTSAYEHMKSTPATRIEINLAKTLKAEKLRKLKNEFANAAYKLLLELEAQDVSYIENYPSYLPSFDEFVNDIFEIKF